MHAKKCVALQHDWWKLYWIPGLAGTLWNRRWDVRWTTQMRPKKNLRVPKKPGDIQFIFKADGGTQINVYGPLMLKTWAEFSESKFNARAIGYNDFIGAVKICESRISKHEFRIPSKLMNRVEKESSCTLLASLNDRTKREALEVLWRC